MALFFYAYDYFYAYDHSWDALHHSRVAPSGNILHDISALQSGVIDRYFMLHHVVQRCVFGKYVVL